MAKTYTFEGPFFQTYKGKLKISAHVAVLIKDDDGTVDNRRCCLTMNDTGTWQWAPEPDPEIVFPLNFLTGINAAVSAQVLKFPIDHPIPEVEVPVKPGPSPKELALSQLTDKGFGEVGTILKNAGVL